MKWKRFQHVDSFLLSADSFPVFIPFPSNEDLWFSCDPVFFDVLLSSFPNEFTAFLKSHSLDEKFEISTTRPNVVYLVEFNRIDLIKILYDNSLSFLEVTDILDSSADDGNLELVKYLSSKNASASKFAVDGASTNGHLAVVEWLLLNRNEGFDGAYLLAAAEGHLDIVQFFIGFVQDLDHQGARLAAEIGGSFEVVDLLDSIILAQG